MPTRSRSLTGRQHSRRIRFLQPPEVEALLRAVPEDELGAVERALYLCAAMAGLRQGELLALKWLDVDSRAPDPRRRQLPARANRRARQP